MKQYFFVPGSKLDKIEYISSLKIDMLIIDLEDAVEVSSRERITQELIDNKFYKEHYIRVALHGNDGNLDISTLTKLYKAGYKKFVFPKLKGILEIEEVLNPLINGDISIILLIETPRLLLEIMEVMERFKNFFNGLAIGSHDLMSYVGSEHLLPNLYFPRSQILYVARSFNIEAIDIASMELKDENEFISEVTNGISMGFDAKFYIHPWQIKVSNKISLYSQEKLEWATRIISALSRVENEFEFKPVIIDGEIIERPHLDRAKKIIEYFNK